MLNNLLEDLNETIADVKAELAKLQKSLEKQLIRSLVAHPCYAVSQTRQLVVKEMKQQSADALKKASTLYQQQLEIAAKSQWAEQAQKVVQSVAAQLNQL
ncbi:hypothetical protein ACSFB8_07930 [Enterococcus faecalis]